MTVNQWHFMQNVELLKELADKKLIYGLGISLESPVEEFVTIVQQFPNAVIHVINGIVHSTELEMLARKGLKILILGYKEFRRGEGMYQNHGKLIETFKSELYNTLPTIINDNWFKVVSFDNLAIKQLDPKRLMSEDKWNEFYMGDDGQFTMYVDLVKREFAKSSISTKRYALADDIKTMFDKVRCE